MENVNVKITNRYKLNPTNVTLLKADTNYTLIFFTDGSKFLYSKTLALFEENLKPFPKLKRINRSTIINLDSIKTHSKGTVILKTGEKIAVSRRRMKEFKIWWKTYQATA